MSREPDAPFVIEGSYFGRRRFERTFERDGLEMTFHGWAYPLEDYTRALEDAGLRIEAMREPVGTPEPDERWSRLPMFLMFRANAG